MSAEKEYKNDFVAVFYQHTGKFGTFWRSIIDEDGGQYVLNQSKDGKDYEFYLTYNPNAGAELEEYKRSKETTEAPKKRSFRRKD